MSGILIVGMGNVLRRDDGFGVEVTRRLVQENDAITPELRASVKIIEVGIGGIHLVQELMDGYDVLVIVDAMERGSSPGTVHVLQAEVEDLATWADDERGDFLADMHYATPSKAMILAKALGVLPPSVFIVGCQPSDVDDVGIGLSEPVAHAVDVAVGEIAKIVGSHHSGVIEEAR